jgi:PAS domain S-box-containing protein
MPKKNWPNLTQKRDIFIFIFGLSLILFAAGYLYYSNEENTIRNEKYNEIKSIASLKIDQITSWYRDEVEDASIIVRNTVLHSTIINFLNQKNANAKSNVIEELNSIIEEHGYENILLIDNQGKFLLSAKPESDRVDSSINVMINKCVTEKKAVALDLFKDNTTNKNWLGFISPILNDESEVSALMVFLINPNAYLFPLIQTWPSSSKTAETILVRKEGNSALILNEARHQKNTSLNKYLSLSLKEIPSVRAVLGYENIYEGKDYRGKEVLTYLKKIPDTPWYMVAKVDKSEIYSELHFKTVVLIVFIILIILLVGAALAWIYHYRQRNIYKELYKKEKELWESHEEFKITLYSIGDGVITTDTKGIVKQMNHEAEILTGWSETEAKGKYFEEVFIIINEQSRNKVDNPISKVLKEGKIVGLANHTLLIAKDGKERPIADSGAPIKNKAGEIIGVVLVFKDQSKEYEAQKNLEESEGRLRLALQSAGQSIFEYDIKSNELSFTSQYKKILGHEAEVLKINATEWIEKVHDEDKELLRKVFNECFQRKVPEYTVEFRQQNKEGEWRWFYSKGKLIIDENDIPQKLIGTLIDISFLKKIQKELLEAKERAEKSEKIKSEFLAQMSHEIRSPINVILSYVDLIKNNLSGKVDEEYLPAFESISHAGKRIIRTIDLILNMSDLQLGTYDLVKKEFDIIALLQDEIREYLHTAKNKNIDIKLKSELNCSYVNSDEYAVNQIFANLLDNAVKYTERGKITVDVNKNDSQQLIIKINDTGIGISEDYLPVLFTPFSQEEQGYSRKFDGNGLGLSLVKKYCDLLDLQISVNSKKNVGTTFTIVFPK